MTTHYKLKKATDLNQYEVETALEYWEVEEWRQMSLEEFKETFNQSEFHFLTDDRSNILCLARINFDFSIQIQQEIYQLAELVGLVATVKMKGYGRKLLHHIRQNLTDRDIEAIGFCESQLRSFYEKCHIHILLDKAKQLREKQINEWVVPTDDDILDLSLSTESRRVLDSLHPNSLGYLLFS